MTYQVRQRSPRLVRFVLYARRVIQLPFEWDILGVQWRYPAESHAKVIDLKDLNNNLPVGLVKSCVMKVFLRLIVGHFIISKKVKAWFSSILRKKAFILLDMILVVKYRNFARCQNSADAVKDSDDT